MEIVNKSSSLEEKLIAGEQVECLKCHSGKYQPFNPESKINHVFRCDQCGDSVTLEPNIASLIKIIDI
jgi:hypothetical protein